MLLFYFVTSYFYLKVQKYLRIINNSQVDNQYGLWLLTDQWWLMSNGNYITIGLEFLVNKIQQQQQQQCLAAATSDSANSSDEAPEAEDEDTFMSQDTSSATADNILSTYTGNTSTPLDDLHAYPLLKNIFLELNTALLATFYNCCMLAFV